MAKSFLAHLAAIVVLAVFFANIEIQIEGSAGWAMNLPTWRIEHHWLLDLFWGGRAMTGYHAWVFPFIFLFFHYPMVVAGNYSWRAECGALAGIMLFWVIEDFLWFVLNPAWGMARFNAETAIWHKHWLWHAPIEYWFALPLGVALLLTAHRKTQNSH